ncbi:MAG: PIN domain-containing protein [Phormidesmis sp. CAN_BIN44]|nr:PIN domain-containing protein [Phormidesmis sp. CAN_BIN44]
MAQQLFVDTLFWVATVNLMDQWHVRAVEIESTLPTHAEFLTTELVLVEFLNYLCGYGAQMRQQVATMVQTILSDEAVTVIPQSQDLFLAGLQLYESRLDKGYSLTDCVSMVVMRQEGIQDVLTHDRHFAQEGFTVLL